MEDHDSLYSLNSRYIISMGGCCSCHLGGAMQWKGLWIRLVAWTRAFGNWGLPLLCLVPAVGSFAAIYILVDFCNLKRLLASSFRFDNALTLEVTSAFYIFAVTIVGFYCVAAVAIVVCIQTQFASAPPGRRRRIGMYVTCIVAAAFFAWMIAERLWGDPLFRTPGFLFASAFESAFEDQVPSSDLLLAFDWTQWLFQGAIATVFAAYAFAAAAAGACASPAPDGVERSINAMRGHLALQMARHHRVFYAATATLLVMLLVSKAHLDVYEALLADAEDEAGKVTVHMEGGTAVASLEGGIATASMQEIRLGIEVYWGAILSLSLAAIYVPAALVHHYRLRRVGGMNLDPPPEKVGAQPLQIDNAAKIAMRIGLILLPSLFSGGVAELVAAIIQ